MSGATVTRGNPAGPRLLLGAVALVLVTAAGLVGMTGLATPAPAAADAPAGEFAAGRAVEHVARIADRPRPIGSARAAEVRAYLVAELRRLGLDVEVHEAVSQRTPAGGIPVIATVRNIHARTSGTNSTGDLVLQAHYDSVPVGPGASDNGSNVGALLEMARALNAGAPLRNDVHILLTDGEEPGLLGAEAIVRSGRFDPARTVVINLEARGSSGPMVMFRTAGDSGRLVAALDRARRPVTTSVANEVFSLLPNDTDLTVYRDAGFRGMDFARLADSINYDTSTDTPAHLDPSAVQHTGDTLLAVVRDLGMADLSTPAGGQVTYFTVGGRVLRYPVGWVLPLAALALMACALTLWYARRRGVPLRAVVVTALTFPVPIVVAAATGWVVWRVLLLAHPGYALLLVGDPYRPGPYRVGLPLLAGAGTVAWYALIRRRASAEQAMLGVLAVFAVLAVLLGAGLPGGGYLFAWPALLGSAAIAAGLRWSAEGSPWRVAAAAVIALPGLLLLLPITVLLMATLGVAGGAVTTAVAVPLLATLLPVIELAAPAPRPRRGLAAAAALAGVALCVAGHMVDPGAEDPAHPRHTSLSYALDHTTGEALWLSGETDPPAWLRQYVGGEPVDITARFPNVGRFSPRYLTGPAPRGADVAPAVEVVAARTEGTTRILTVRITPGEGTYRTAVYAAAAGGSLESATVAGSVVPGADNRLWADPPWRWGFVYWPNPDEDSFEVTIRLRGADPAPLRVVSYRAGLPEQVRRDLPDAIAWSLGLTNLRMIATTAEVSAP